MKPGRIVDRFESDGQEVVIRYPRREDVVGLMKYINGMVKERTQLGTQKRVTLKKERAWLAKQLRAMEQKKLVHLIVEMDGVIVGGAELMKGTVPWRDHAGFLGIGLSREARGRGIGERLYTNLEREAKRRLKVRFIDLNHMATNTRAHRFYHRMGFKHVGRIKDGLKYFGRYVDEIIMVKHLR